MRAAERSGESARTAGLATRIDEADALARALLDHVRGARGVETAEIAGSLRRRREMVGDLDLLAASKHPARVAERFLAFPGVAEVLARGDARCVVVLRSGVKIDLRVVDPACWGAALVTFTGSEAHDLALRTRARARELKLDEHGVFRRDRRVAGRTEDDVYRALGLPWIPPELREDRGEIAAAEAGRLPTLVSLADVRGDLHVHTDASDGAASLEQMVRACAARGYEYVAITDHTPAVRAAHGLDAARFRRQAHAIEAVRRACPEIAVLRGAEVDVLEDGRLDLDDETLSRLDVVVISVHSHLAQGEAQMTDRVIRAMRHPSVAILAHPTGRQIGRRAPYAIDLARVLRAAADLAVLVEINAQPERLDVDDVHARMAKDAGAKLVVSTDAHRVSELDLMRFGIDQARRGWCTADDVANTRSLGDLRRLLRAKAELTRASTAPPALGAPSARAPTGRRAS